MLRQVIGSIRESLIRWGDAAGVAPRLAASAVRRGILPLGFSTLATLRREGLSDLHWKVLGDSLVRFFRESGPVLTKLGQLLAVRNDLLPQAVCARLEALYTGQPAMPKRQLRRVLKQAYPSGSPFAEFHARPIAVGSIGQVHRARLPDGSPVIVKVIRPGMARAIRRDLNAARVFTKLFFMLFRRDRKSTRLMVSRALEDLAQALELESNLEHEAETVEDFRKRLARNPNVYVPICYRDWSRRDILVLEELTGKPLSLVREQSKEHPDVSKRTAHLALKEILSQIFEEGRFHADPHGGNLLLLEDGRLGLIDLGLTGELGLHERRHIARAAKAFLSRDADAAIRALLEFGSISPDFDLESFKTDVKEVLRENKDDILAHATGRTAKRKNGTFRLGELVNELIRVAGRHGIYLPPSTTLLIKTVVTIEGVARSLDPELNLVVTAVPIILKSLTPRFLRWSYWTGSG